MENFSEHDIERDEENLKNKVAGDVEERLEIYRQGQVPENEMRKLLADLKGKLIHVIPDLLYLTLKFQLCLHDLDPAPISHWVLASN